MPNLGSGNVIKNESFFRGGWITHTKKREIRQLDLSFAWVRMARVELARESNSHRLTPTTPSKWRVYHFTTSAFELGLQRYAIYFTLQHFI